MKKVLVSVSSLPAEKSILTYVKAISPFADFLHCDIMDGTLTANKTLLNSVMLNEINEQTTLPLDVHLMVRTPLNYISKYARAGANIITTQIESFDSLEQGKQILSLIRKKKCLCGLAVDLSTDISQIVDYLPIVDIVLLMSVNIGKYGQKFNDSVFKKIKFLQNEKIEKGYNFLIEVDGGINNENCVKLSKSGVDILVSGNYVFNDTNYQSAINTLKKSSNKK